jgi:hypothetical protein
MERWGGICAPTGLGSNSPGFTLGKIELLGRPESGARTETTPENGFFHTRAARFWRPYRALQ